MKHTFELEVTADGTIGMVYQDGVEQFADEMGAELVRTCRVSYVEPEGKYWTVRSAPDTELAIRWHSNGIEPAVSREGKIMLFDTRDEALQQEIRFIKELRHG